MDFLPSDDQQALRQGVREVCTDAFPRERLGELAADGSGFDASLWSTLTELGVFGLRLPEDEGGLGLGLADAALVFQELGRALVPGPLVGTFLAASVLGGLSEGLEVGAPVAVLDLSAEEPGRTPLVEHAQSIAALVVLEDDEARLVRASELSLEPVSVPVDPLTPVSKALSLPEGELLPGGAARWRVEGAVLTAALEAGMAAACVDISTQYAKEREQFGRAIGSFQAVKHILADMYVRAELASVAVESAAVTLDQPEVGDAARAVASAKLLADDAAALNAKWGVQVHGGMGFTWEVVMHYYLKRAWVHQTQFGDVETHADALAALL